MFARSESLWAISSLKDRMCLIKKCKWIKDFDSKWNAYIIFVTSLLYFSQSLVTGLQEVDKLKHHCENVHVPLEVFDYIDQGRNPQLYTKDCIEKALMKNEEVKGKIDSYRKFKANMLVELQKAFPNELNKYRAIRGDE